MEENSTVFIGTLVRDREWIIPDLLNHIRKIDYPKNKIHILFYVNNCSDNSHAVLSKLVAGNNFKDYRFVSICHRNFDVPPDIVDIKNGTRDCHTRKNYIYNHLSDLRNLMISNFIGSGCDYYLSLDSDILVSPDILNKLISLNTYSAAAVVANDFGKGHICNVMDYHKDTNRFKRVYPNSVEGDIVKCDLSGACILFKRELFTDYPEMKYEFHSQGEDGGLSMKMIKRGIRTMAMKSLAKHIMSKEMLEKCL